MFDKLIGNDHIKNIFGRLIKTKRIPHSLLFTGKDGIGKKHFALEVAKSFVCQSPNDFQACDECKACLRADKFHIPNVTPTTKVDKSLKAKFEKVFFSEHSDIAQVVPLKTNIFVNAIRHLEESAHFRPYEGRARVFIIDDADKMNDSATNALLKTLEEPIETTYLFLITSRPSALLPTILSRCQTIRFAPIEAAEIEKYLLKSDEFSSDDAKLLAKLSRGSIVAAVHINLEDYYRQRFKMLDVLRSLSNRRNFTILLRTTEELCDPKNKDDYENNLEILQTLIHDIWTLKNNAEAEIINSDIAEKIQQLSENTNNQTLAEWMTEIETLLNSLKSNLNKKIATDALFMKMSG